MLKNYIIVAFRHLSRHKLHTAINLFGLSIGLACSLMLIFYLKDELTYDQHFAKYDQIYRVWGRFDIRGEESNLGRTPGPLAATLKKDFPEVQKATRLAPAYGKSFLYHKVSRKSFIDEQLFYADANIFEFFNCEFIVGKPEQALSQPNTIVLTESLAKKFFGSASRAINEVLFHNQTQKGYRITAVIQDLPQNTSFRFNGLITMVSDKKPEESVFNYWGSISTFTFVQLPKNFKDIGQIERKLDGFYQKKAKQDIGDFEVSGSFQLQSLAKIHLESNRFAMDVSYKGNWQIIYIFFGVLCFILIIASINYMNLATARSATRAREVGIRKVLGAYRLQLIIQFLTEAIITAFIALLLALIFVELLLPLFNQFTDKSIRINYFDKNLYLPQIMLLVLIIGLLSGSYPAFLLSGFRPVSTLKGKNAGLDAKYHKRFRQFLVVLQFSISITLIICTGIALSQFQYIKQKNLGFSQSQILVMEIEGYTCHKAETIQKELLNLPEVEAVAGTNATLGTSEHATSGVFIERENGELREFMVHTFLADSSFFDLMGIEIIQGRNFSRQFGSDSTSAVLVNETLVDKIGWKNPLGKRFSGTSDESASEEMTTPQVVGVFRDFHLLSLHQRIEPLVITPTFKAPRFYPNRIYIKFQSQLAGQILTKVESIYREFDQKRPFEAYFLDQVFARQYRKDQQQLQILLSFSIVAILIACLGLFGLTSFTIEQRTKEIGLRKVLGASFSQLLLTINQDFLKLVLLANVLALPTAVWLMNMWLQSFAYRVQLINTWPIFIVSGILAFLVAVITVSTLSYRISQLNPAEVLKYE